jgi:peptide/nickel transport system permease protein
MEAVEAVSKIKTPGIKKEAGDEKILVASQWQLTWWRFRKHKVAMASSVVLLIMYTLVLFAEFAAPYDPRSHDRHYIFAPPQKIHLIDAAGEFHLWPFTYNMVGEMDQETYQINYVEDQTIRYPLAFFVHGDPYKMWGMIKSDIHLFGSAQGGTLFLVGTDKLGRDLLSRTIHGGRISLTIGLVGIAMTFFFGILIGGASGYFGGVVDIITQRIIEFLRSIPTLPLWMALSVALPPHWSTTKTYFGIILILSLIGWTGLARVVRGKFMSLREEDFVMAARLNNASELRIIFHHMVPSFASYLIAFLTLSVPAMILAETALSFIGLGLQAPAISWGVLLKDAQSIRALHGAPWLLWPGFAIVITVLAFNFMGDGLRDAADPYG